MTSKIFGEIFKMKKRQDDKCIFHPWIKYMENDVLYSMCRDPRQYCSWQPKEWVHNAILQLFFSKPLLHFSIWISISLFVVHVRVSFYLYGLYPLKLDHYDFNNRMQYLQTILRSGKAISLNDSCIFDSPHSHFLPPNQKQAAASGVEKQQWEHWREHDSCSE